MMMAEGEDDVRAKAISQRICQGYGIERLIDHIGGYDVHGVFLVMDAVSDQPIIGAGGRGGRSERRLSSSISAR